MRDFFITLAGAIGGAVLAVVVIWSMAQRGLLPINDRQMQTYLMLHPELAQPAQGPNAGDEAKHRAWLIRQGYTPERAERLTRLVYG